MLLDSESYDEFDSLFAELKKTWLYIDASRKFVNYVKSLAPMMKTSMIASVRSTTGLGSPPIRYYTNDSESNNFRLKNWLGFREKPLPEFITELASFVEGEKSEVQKAYCNLPGKFHVRKEF